MILKQILKSSIRKYDVIELFRSIDLKYGITGVKIRNDNGSQFIANDVKRSLIDMEAQQEFTHVATTRGNAYIKDFHSIIQGEVIKRHEFNSFYETKTTFQRYLISIISTENTVQQEEHNTRKMGSVEETTRQNRLYFSLAFGIGNRLCGRAICQDYPRHRR
jgi:transposase InsO family protein